CGGAPNRPRHERIAAAVRGHRPPGYTARMNTTLRIALLALFAALALAACGNQGPLVLPDEDASEEVFDEAVEEADATDAVGDEAEAETPVDDADPAGDGRG